MLKLLFLTHRYLGIGLSLVMLLWCLSGFVMMYKPYPELNQQQQLETLEKLKLVDCCAQINLQQVTDNKYQLSHLMMLDGAPMLHLYSEDGQLSIYNLENGQPLDGISESNALGLANKYADRYGYPDPSLNALIQNDQWTVYSSYNIHRPLYHFSANDKAGTQWYISSRSGEIIQITTREQRIWGYLGAVIHWIYPTILREKAQLWSQTVIWLSVLGTFLTLTGIYFGLKQYKTRKKGGKSPYKGWSLWHHYSGLLFGLLTLTWVLSGLFSMQPWGLFEGGSANVESQRLRGGAMSIEEINNSLNQLNGLELSESAVLLEGRELQQQLFWLSMDIDLNKIRYQGTSFNTSMLTEIQLRKLAEVVVGEAGIKQSFMLNEEDNYYFSHHNEVSLPVYKVVADNADRTTYYLDATDGSIVNKFDTARKGYRWFHYGMHRLDFSVLSRSRPFWDILLLVLLSGVTFGVFTGLFLGVRRLRRGL